MSADARPRDRGAASLALVITLVATLAGAGLIVDGGRAMVARRHASNFAEAAARAGVATARPDEPLDPLRARAAVYFAAAVEGVPPTDLRIVVSDDVVEVTVTERRPTVFLVLGGRSTLTVRATGRARLHFSG
ncbi:MAG: pilus assembly protein TadG-related protein [Ilumatobacteraceae bacterium]